MAEDTQQEEQEENFEILCNELRTMIKDTSVNVKDLMAHSELVGGQSAERMGRDDEMRANIMLAYRHLEDARMRVGKILQAKNGGVSVYDK